MANNDYLRNSYAHFWRNRTYSYGISKTEEYVIDLFMSKGIKSAFEVGIGNGFPYAKPFVTKELKFRGVI